MIFHFFFSLLAPNFSVPLSPDCTLSEDVFGLQRWSHTYVRTPDRHAG